jgi:hypothetical protein
MVLRGGGLRTGDSYGPSQCQDYLKWIDFRNNHEEVRDVVLLSGLLEVN